jgi:hypothetical protein
LACLWAQVVFMTGSLLKTIIAKMLSSRFHKAAHFDKLQDALHKARRRQPSSHTPCSHCIAY